MEIYRKWVIYPKYVLEQKPELVLFNSRFGQSPILADKLSLVLKVVGHLLERDKMFVITKCVLPSCFLYYYQSFAQPYK